MVVYIICTVHRDGLFDIFTCKPIERGVKCVVCVCMSYVSTPFNLFSYGQHTLGAQLRNVFALFVLILYAHGNKVM